MTSVLKKSVIYAAATIGVGMLGGKENALFVGGTTNVVLFAVVFALSRFAFSEWVRTTGANDVSDLCRKSFGRGSIIAEFALLLTDTVAVIAILGGAEFTLRKLTTDFPLPFFGIAVCAVASLFGASGTKALSIVSNVCLTVSVAAVICCGQPETPTVTGASFCSTIVYAVFCAAMLVGTDCDNAGNSAKENAAIAITTSLLVSVVVSIVALNGGVRQVNGTAAEAAITLCFVLSASTGVFAVSRPPIIFLQNALHDDGIASYLFFAFCLIGAMLDPDAVIGGSYTFTAVTCTTLLSVSFVLKIVKNARNKEKHRVLCVK